MAKRSFRIALCFWCILLIIFILSLSLASASESIGEANVVSDRKGLVNDGNDDQNDPEKLVAKDKSLEDAKKKDMSEDEEEGESPEEIAKVSQEAESESNNDEGDEDDEDSEDEEEEENEEEEETSEEAEALLPYRAIPTGLQNITIDPQIKVVRGDVEHPKIAWLMSFPNSGTSFTIHMTRDSTNTTTATNYAFEGDVKDLPSTPAILGPAGEKGPFLELIRNRFTNVPETILTKTHCTGFCSQCGPYKLLFETPRSFMLGCLSGTRAVHGAYGLEAIEVTYDPSLVTKALHIFRHPLDNIVARFHLEFDNEEREDNDYYVKKYPRNQVGFQRWCQRSDESKDLFETRYIDNELKDALQRIPCFNEFFKYVQWHNMAFYTCHDMNLEVLNLHYHEYEENFPKAREKIFNFLGLTLVGNGMEFRPGKKYRHYYTSEQKKAIREFIQLYATRDTWNMIKNYDFEIDSKPQEMKAATS